MRRVLLIIAICLVPIIPIVLVVTGALKGQPQTVNAVTLRVWGTEDTAEQLVAIIARYRSARSYTSIEYTQMRSEDYAQQLVSAWAQGNGPDVFFVPQSWVGQMSQYAVPMPASLAVPQIIVSKGVLGKNTKVVNDPQAAPSIAALKNVFVDTVMEDVVWDNQVWGLPWSMDTLVAYYNKDLLNNAKIFEPAKTWSDLQNQVANNRLTVTNEQGQLVQSGVALGTVANLPYATDLLTLLMMQNGVVMTTADKQVGFNDADGLTALNFYLSFAQSKKTTYSWNANQPNAREAFLQGKVAYYFGTLADRTIISAGNINWGVSPMLHITVNGDNDGATDTQRYIDVAKYQVAMVSRSSQVNKRSVNAWNFVEYVSQAGNVTTYLQPTNKLSAVKSVLAKQKDDQNLGVYAGQLLTARGWYHGKNGPAVDTYLSDLITTGLTGATDPQELLELAAQQVKSTL